MPRKNKQPKVDKLLLKSFEACKSKKKYRTEEEAKRAIDLHATFDKNIDAYKCDYCGNWHLTSK